MASTDLKKNFKLPFETTRERVIEALKGQGFGVLTEIDVRATLEKKLGVDFRKYAILGACNPPMAYKALTAVEDIGLFLPCNVIVYDAGEGTTTVAMVDPNRTIASVGVEGLEAVAREVHAMLEKALASVSEV